MSLQKVQNKKSRFSENKTKIKVLEFALKKNIKQNEKQVEKLDNLEQKVGGYKSIFDQLKEKIECPVCLEIPRANPSVCVNGHFVCQTCKTNSCPTCRVAMGGGKSLLAVTIIENIEHKCKFVDCEEVFVQDELEAHEKICKHRTVNCPYELCDEKVALSKLLDHIGKAPCSFNSVQAVKAKSPESGQVNFTAKINQEPVIDVKSVYWKVYTHNYRGANFAICANKADNLYHFTMVMFETEAECAKYNIEIAVHEENSSVQDSELSFRFRGQPCSVDEAKVDCRYLGLTVNHKGMAKIFRKSDKCAFFVSFQFYEK